MSADPTGRSLFIVDNSVSGWPELRYLKGVGAFDITHWIPRYHSA